MYIEEKNCGISHLLPIPGPLNLIIQMGTVSGLYLQADQRYTVPSQHHCRATLRNFCWRTLTIDEGPSQDWIITLQSGRGELNIAPMLISRALSFRLSHK